MIEPLCRLCLEGGRVTPATIADHVTLAAGAAHVIPVAMRKELVTLIGPTG